jgi:DNA-binding CsgD family transcriptional regulator
MVSLLVASGVVVLVSLGQAQGFWLANLHNGLLGVAFTFVGGYVLFQRPGHPEGRLFLATGAVEALLFFGRQLGHFPAAGRSPWLGWFGVWPTAIALGLTTVSVLGFPDGRAPSRSWRWVAAGVGVIAVGCASVSAIWPVEYGSTGVVTADPINAHAASAAASVWSAVAHPAYAAFQVLWVLVVIYRWRIADGPVRRQLAFLVGAAGISVVALVAGLVAAGSPRAGVLTATLVPVAAGWAIVHGQHVAAYSALTWLSRADAEDLPTGLARAVAEALSAPGATLWMGSNVLVAVGVWPETDTAIAPTIVEDLESSPTHARVVTSRGATVGAITVHRRKADALSLAEDRLLGDLASQAALLIDHLGLADLIAGRRFAAHVERLSARERDVLDLMARGRSNAAICQELHLSIKTVEPIVGAIFDKLGLHADTSTNRRVLAVLAYIRT